MTEKLSPEQLWYISQVYPEAVTLETAALALKEYETERDDRGACLSYGRAIYRLVYGEDPSPV
jgi:hypothetical protein